LCGKALVLGYDVDGNSIDPKVSLEKLKSMVAFIPSYFVMGIS
jgi:hypothetical protein